MVIESGAAHIDGASVGVDSDLASDILNVDGAGAAIELDVAERRNGDIEIDVAQTAKRRPFVEAARADAEDIAVLAVVDRAFVGAAEPAVDVFGGFDFDGVV